MEEEEGEGKEEKGEGNKQPLVFSPFLPLYLLPSGMFFSDFLPLLIPIQILSVALSRMLTSFLTTSYEISKFMQNFPLHPTSTKS